MAKPANDWKNLVARGKVQKYYHLQTNIPTGNEEELEKLGEYLAKNGFVYENNVCEVLRACMEIVRVTFAQYVKDDVPMRIPPGYKLGPGVKECQSDART